MRRKRREDDPGPATLGTTARAHLLLHVWCNDCRHRVDIDPGEQALRYGPGLAVPEWASRLTCSRCGSRQVDFVVTPRSTGGTEDR
jgi:DNA-directed RNA polymerase subunit RPC12/RpoP